MRRDSIANPSLLDVAGIEALSPQDRFLAGKAEEAIRDGLQLEHWYREQEPALHFFPLALKKTYRLPNKAEGFFSSLSINGTPRTVMGCRQKVDFGSIAASGRTEKTERTEKTAKTESAERLREFVLGEFLKRAHWTYDDGAPGGFTFEKSLYRTVGGQCGKFSTEKRDGPVDWRELGQQYQWVLLTVHIHDFIVNMGLWRKRIRETAYVAPHPDFVHVVEHPSQEYVLEVSIGYPFVDVAPVPNVFGFGPGKFGVAVKLFSFFLTSQGSIRVRMVFAAAPRAQKVLDLGKHWPDPIYGGAELLHYLTLGLLKPETIHNRMDAQMLALHCQVHQTLMDGVAKVWSDWVNQKASAIAPPVPHS